MMVIADDMRGKFYEALAERVVSVLGYNVRGQPNEHEPSGFVGGVRPLELTNGKHEQQSCPEMQGTRVRERMQIRCSRRLKSSSGSPMRPV